MRTFNPPEDNLAAAAMGKPTIGGPPVTATQAEMPRNRKPFMFRASTLTSVSLLGLLAAAPLGRTQEPPSLMTMIAQWQYPGSRMSGATMSDAATMNSTGERTLPSIQFKTVLISKDPISKVIDYYKTKLMPTADAKTTKPDEKPAARSGRSVTFHDDSEGRPLAIHVILINTDKASTTLVISRGATESETHIAWTHYLKLQQPPPIAQGGADETLKRGEDYEHSAQILAMPSRRATVMEIGPCYAVFRTEGGRTFVIGSLGSPPEVVGFLGNLEKGKSYFLPDAFMDYQKAQQAKPNKADPRPTQREN